MKKGMLYAAMMLLVSIVTISCANDSDEQIEAAAKTGTTVSEINEWIYAKMTEWYLWNEDIKSLSPDFNQGYEKFFNSLLSTNKFDGQHDSYPSYYYSYIEKVPAGSDTGAGYETGFGFEFGLVVRQLNQFEGDLPVERVFALVNYVYEGSPAWKAGIRRGDYIGTIDGTEMTLSNYSSVYPAIVAENKTGKSLSSVEIEWFSLTDSGETFKYYSLDFNLANYESMGKKTLSPSTYAKNPVAAAEIITSESGAKVGYLAYTSFEYGNNHIFDDNLKKAVSSLQGVSELVLDLRYNTGGFVSSAQLLASMIVPSAKQGSVFVNADFNEAVKTKSNDNYRLEFVPVAEMKSDRFGKTATGANLDLKRVYILSSELTACAAETLINGLRGADIEVILIGSQTEGKNVGLTMVGPDEDGGIYDGYEYRIWPVSFICANAKGESDYSGGFAPDYTCDEYDLIEWKQFGDKDDKLVAAAIHHIDNGSFPIATRSASTAGSSNVLFKSASIGNAAGTLMTF